MLAHLEPTPASPPGWVRGLEMETRDRLDTLSRHLATLVGQGRQVIVATWHAPHEQLQERLTALGVDPARLFFVDAVGGRAIGGPRFLPNVLFVESPMMLEKALVRVEAACRRLGRPITLVVDSVNLLELYNPPAAADEFLHLIINRMRNNGVAVDVILVRHRDMARSLDRIRGLADEMGSLSEPGSPASQPT